jgi:hypothetical protein
MFLCHCKVAIYLEQKRPAANSSWPLDVHPLIVPCRDDACLPAWERSPYAAPEVRSRVAGRLRAVPELAVTAVGTPAGDVIPAADAIRLADVTGVAGAIPVANAVRPRECSREVGSWAGPRRFRSYRFPCPGS